jgi:hypothetical protein
MYMHAQTTPNQTNIVAEAKRVDPICPSSRQTTQPLALTFDSSLCRPFCGACRCFACAIKFNPLI